MSTPTLIILGLAVACFFAGVVVLVSGLAGSGLRRVGVARGLTSIDHIYGAGGSPAPGASPVMPPPVVRGRLARVGEVASPPTAMSWLRRRLDFAGNPPFWTIERVYEIKGLGLLAFGLVGATVGLSLGGPVGAVIAGPVAAVLGFVIPDVVVYDLSLRRQERIRRTLPDILDTLTVSVEAGLGFDAAVAQITRYGQGPLAGEFARVLQEMQIGRSRGDALRALGRRTSVAELRSFCAIVVQATELGVPIANVLREQSKEMRVRRRQRAEELAQKVPVKILFPLIFCLFPALFIVVLGPGVINILAAFNL